MRRFRFFAAVLPTLYVANHNNSISVFDTLHANDPRPEITGGGLNNPISLAVSPSGKLHVGNGSYFAGTPGTVSIFDTTQGNAAPITGSGVIYPQGLAVH